MAPGVLDSHVALKLGAVNPAWVQQTVLFEARLARLPQLGAASLQVCIECIYTHVYIYSYIYSYIFRCTYERMCTCTRTHSFQSTVYMPMLVFVYWYIYI